MSGTYSIKQKKMQGFKIHNVNRVMSMQRSPSPMLYGGNGKLEIELGANQND